MPFLNRREAFAICQLLQPHLIWRAVQNKTAQLIFIFFAGICTGISAWAADGKLLGTPGVFQIEGAAGGGLVPWAQLAGYASDREMSASAFCSNAQVDDYQLRVCGAQLNWRDRVEASVARQQFIVEALNIDIHQNIYAIKARLYGDVVYSHWPQVSLGLQYKHLLDSQVAYLFGATDDRGTDVYLAASKLHLGGLMGYNTFWNLSLRSTEANQIGLLGFGGEASRRIQAEISTAIFINRYWALGMEYRQKPDNLAIREDDWRDLFVAWFPNKSFNITAAWLDLGEVAGIPGQRGWYLSLGGYW